MALYLSDTKSRPRFQMRIPRDLAADLSFSCLSVPLDPAPKRVLRRRTIALANAAHRMFANLRMIDKEALKKLSRSGLSEALGRHCDALCNGFLRDPTDAESGPNVEDINGVLRTTEELLQRPPPIRSLFDRKKSLPAKGLLTLERLHQDGAFLVDQEFDGCLERLLHFAMSDDRLQSIMVGLPVSESPVPSANRPPNDNANPFGSQTEATKDGLSKRNCGPAEQGNRQQSAPSEPAAGKP